MQPVIQPLGAILYSPNQYVIPVYQRHYRWDAVEWEKLWDNLQELRQPGVTGKHFMGFLVLKPGLPQPGRNTGFHLVDGQQRLTTCSLLLIAIRNLARKNSLDALADEIHNYYLVHPPKRDTEHFRLFPKERDNEDYLTAVKGEKPVQGRMGRALRYFEGKLAETVQASSEPELRAVFELLCQRLEFMCATLEHENAYNIFKSLNSTGVPLEAADLIRNFVFMHISPDDQDAFDRDLWRPLETRFNDKLGNFNSTEFSGFFRVFLERGGRYVKEDATFETFEERYEAAGFSPIDLSKELTTFANYYDIIRGRSPEDAPDVDKALVHLRSLESSTTHPLLLNLFHRRAQDALTNDDLAKCVRMLSGFIMRRFICGESSRGYGRQFVKACDSLSAHAVQSLYVFLESKGWPDALQFESAFRTFNLYERGYGKFILESLEAAHDHREPADTSAAEIEHIMPQTLSATWKSDLGADAERIHGERLHTPGNLTLSAYNRELWNYPFAEKRLQYAQSNIVMTRKLSESAKWGEDEIRARGQSLAEMASEVWIGPVGLKELI
jgi:uncharacterized protein with ParB-like and HNH nuclease domain